MKLLMSQETNHILKAMAKVKKQLTSVIKDQKNPFFKSSYADLNQHLDAVTPLLEDHGLMLLQPTSAEPTANYVTTLIIHADSGQFFGGTLSIPQLKDPQKLGAAITYFRRFGINSLFALKSVDDDGESAVGRGSFKPKFKKSSKSFKKHNDSEEDDLF